MVQLIRIDELSLCLYTQLHTLAPPCGLFFLLLLLLSSPALSPSTIVTRIIHQSLRLFHLKPQISLSLIRSLYFHWSLHANLCKYLRFLQLSKRSSPRESTSSFAGVDNFEFTTDAVLSQSATRTLTAYPDQLNNAVVIACGIIVFIG